MRQLASPGLPISARHSRSLASPLASPDGNELTNPWPLLSPARLCIGPDAEHPGYTDRVPKDLRHLTSTILHICRRATEQELSLFDVPRDSYELAQHHIASGEPPTPRHSTVARSCVKQLESFSAGLKHLNLPSREQALSLLSHHSTTGCWHGDRASEGQMTSCRSQ